MINRIKEVIREVQTFYAEQMQAHGYGNTTFRIELTLRGSLLSIPLRVGTTLSIMCKKVYRRLIGLLMSLILTFSLMCTVSSLTMA